MAITQKLREQVSPVLGRLLRGRRAGVRHSVRSAPELQAPVEIGLVSPDFHHEGMIAEANRAPANTSPGLAWHGVPEGTLQLLLVVEDIDAPFKKPLIHALALIDPELSHLESGALAEDSERVRLLPGSFGRRGYHGPKPLPGHGEHRYGFHLYALDALLPATVSGLDEVLRAADGRVLACGFLEGRATDDGSGAESAEQTRGVRGRRRGINLRDLRH
ncbi:hypothetical protein CGZ93_08505 [Enemella dayhoffiae]|uniref:YbhB/YbcL family Raf kinase inhibitor-like protein n=1 Tax=Enemella dayhoffiae TaxID=2016507 RepID=A0A255H5X9_9ACTN|nr:YbhB/YbcL family Raf kinase inhibitor-like protein [Enemella dayhoffiae]OYO21964.1 hypothetical protein CGZ93_08505 [Enemella dayhoffiae]